MGERFCSFCGKRLDRLVKWGQVVLECPRRYGLNGTDPRHSQEKGSR